MNSRRIIFPLTILGVAIVLWWFSPRTQRPTATRGRDEAVRTAAVGPATPTSRALPAEVAPTAAGSEVPNEFPLAARLNAPDGTISADLEALSQIFDAWRTNFPRDGNPVGENHEITAALIGDNPLKLALLPRNHRAINPGGELCDRWGTPFRFHQLSGDRMEIRSAGPDRKFGTPDDALWSPGS